MRYAIGLKPSAAKQLRKLPRPVQVKMAHAIGSLSTDPRPHGVEKLAGEHDLLRIRLGDYRMIYQVQDDRLFILVIRIGHRKEVYR